MVFGASFRYLVVSLRRWEMDNWVYQPRRCQLKFCHRRTFQRHELTPRALALRHSLRRKANARIAAHVFETFYGGKI